MWRYEASPYGAAPLSLSPMQGECSSSAPSTADHPRRAVGVQGAAGLVLRDGASATLDPHHRDEQGGQDEETGGV